MKEIVAIAVAISLLIVAIRSDPQTAKYILIGYAIVGAISVMVWIRGGLRGDIVWRWFRGKDTDI